MKERQSNRRNFIKLTAAASGITLLSGLSTKATAGVLAKTIDEKPVPVRIRFAVININHAHINLMTNAVKRGGGELVSLYAKEPELIAAFIKEFPEVKLVLRISDRWPSTSSSSGSLATSSRRSAS